MRNKKAFTLIELLVVITIIAVLMGASGVSLMNSQKKSRDNKRKANLAVLQDALERYFLQNHMYPQDTQFLRTEGYLSNNQWPKDPDGSDYRYGQKDKSGSSCNNANPADRCLQYVYVACLENLNDPDITVADGVRTGGPQGQGDDECMSNSKGIPDGRISYFVTSPNYKGP